LVPARIKRQIASKTAIKIDGRRKKRDKPRVDLPEREEPSAYDCCHENAMRYPSPDMRQFALRCVVIAGAGILAGLLRWGSLIFVTTNMTFQFTQISVTAGLSYALFKRTSVLNSFLILFCCYLVFTALQDIHGRWMYVLNLIYIAGISSVIYLYLLFIEKPILHGAIRRLAALTVATALVNPLHVIVLVLISLSWSNLQNAHFISHVADTCWFNFQTGTVVGLAVGIGIEAADRSLVQRVLAALKSWALDWSDG
jgi:hypothetical protein